MSHGACGFCGAAVVCAARRENVAEIARLGWRRRRVNFSFLSAPHSKLVYQYDPVAQPMRMTDAATRAERPGRSAVRVSRRVNIPTEKTTALVRIAPKHISPRPRWGKRDCTIVPMISTAGNAAKPSPIPSDPTTPVKVAMQPRRTLVRHERPSLFSFGRACVCGVNLPPCACLGHGATYILENAPVSFPFFLRNFSLT